MLYALPKAVSLHDSHSTKTHHNRKQNKTALGSKEAMTEGADFYLSASYKQLVMLDSLSPMTEIELDFHHRTFLNQEKLTEASAGKRVLFLLSKQGEQPQTRAISRCRQHKL